MPKTLENFDKMMFFTSSISIFFFISLESDVTDLSIKPHGLIFLKKERSVFIFSANPCMVTYRLDRTPMAAILRALGFSASNHTPVAPFQNGQQQGMGGALSKTH